MFDLPGNSSDSSMDKEFSDKKYSMIDPMQMNYPLKIQTNNNNNNILNNSSLKMHKLGLDANDAFMYYDNTKHEHGEENYLQPLPVDSQMDMTDHKYLNFSSEQVKFIKIL